MGNRAEQTDEYSDNSGSARNGIYKSRNELIQEFCKWIPGCVPPQRDMARIGEVDSICESAEQFWHPKRKCMLFEHDVCSSSSSAFHRHNDSFERSAAQDSRVSGSQAKAAVNRQAIEAATPKASAREVDELMAAAYPSAKASPARGKAGPKPKAQPKKKPASASCKKQIEKAHSLTAAALEEAESLLESLGQALLTQVADAIPKVDLDDLASFMAAAHDSAEAAMEVHTAGEGINPTATLKDLKDNLAALKASIELVAATINRLCDRFKIERQG